MNEIEQKRKLAQLEMYIFWYGYTKFFALLQQAIILGGGE
jgi:hypothetical protein